MNYRHAFHAGNFADVFKHAILTRFVEYLKIKPTAFRVIDTHAGPGLYDLAGGKSARTGEWRDGIGRVTAASVPPEVAGLLAPWLEAVRSFNVGSALRHYPGSPTLLRHLLRPKDRLTAIELHPAEVRVLRQHFAGDIQTRVIELDGWLALGAHVPPKEKRGLVLVDPPFEEPGEFGRLVEGLQRAHRRWPGGIYALWYPIKDRRAHDGFRQDLKATSIPKLIDVTLEVAPVAADQPLSACGMIIANPPYPLEAELRLVLPVLADLLGREKGGRFEIVRLTPERLSP